MKGSGLRALSICALLIIGLSGVPRCEEELPPGWTNKVVAYFNLTQAGFDNWAQGGENTLGWQTGLNSSFINLGPRREWLNTAKVAYGMQKMGDQETRKSLDEIVLESVYAYRAGFYVDPYVALKAETQFSKGYAYSDSDKTEISGFLDPGYFTESVGVGRHYGEIVRSRVGLAFKQTITEEFPVPYADDPDTPEKVEKTRYEVGMEWVTDLNLTMSENLLLVSQINLFSDISATSNIDVKWENLLTAKVAEYVNVTLDFKLLYDRDISTKRQIKESLALGLTYSLI